MQHHLTQELGRRKGVDESCEMIEGVVEGNECLRFDFELVAGIGRQ